MRKKRKIDKLTPKVKHHLRRICAFSGSCMLSHDSNNLSNYFY